MKTTANKRFYRTIFLFVSVPLLFLLAVPNPAIAAPHDEPDKAPLHIDRHIQASSDDVRQTALFGGAFSPGAQNLFMGDFGSIPQYIGLRFTSITIPQGATITQAFLTFTASENSSGETELIIDGHDVDHSPTFSEGDGPLDRQAEFTSAQVSWSPDDWFDGSLYASGDISAIIQEIVDRPEWYEGNAISLIISDGDGLNNIFRKFTAWDLDPASSVELTIDFSVPGSSDEAAQMADCQEDTLLPAWLRQLFPSLLSDDSKSDCETGVEDAASEPGPEQITEPEPVLCLTSPECVFVSGFAGLIMLVLGAGLSGFLALRLGISKGGIVLFAMVGAVAGVIIGAGVVGGILTVAMQTETESAPNEVNPDLLAGELDSDSHICEAYLKIYAETETNKAGQVTDILIHIAVPGDVSLPADSRFRLTIWDHFGAPHEFISNDTVISLVGLGLFPGQVSSPLTWQVAVESLAATGGDLFQPFCQAGSVHTYNYDEQPACSEYFETYAETVTNHAGEVVDILIYIVLPGDVILPADSRFRVTVKDFMGNPRYILTNDTSASLAAVGLFPDQIENPLQWQVIIEYLAGPGGDLFLPYCQVDDLLYDFDFEDQVASQVRETSIPTIAAILILPTSTPTLVNPTVVPPTPTFTSIPPTATYTPLPDTSGPQVSSAIASPNPTLTTSTVTISATISDPAGVASATLYYKTGKGAYVEAGQMKPGGGGYTLTIGPLTPAGTYDFRILAVDSLGNPNCSAAELNACPGGTFVVNIP